VSPPAAPQPPDQERPPIVQRLGAVLWPSFFSAGVATMVCFAFIDPLALRDITFPQLVISRELGYTLGFFLFWAATAASSLFTSLLLSPASRFNAPLPRE
jgi:hypothetical protein